MGSLSSPHAGFSYPNTSTWSLSKGLFFFFKPEFSCPKSLLPVTCNLKSTGWALRPSAKKLRSTSNHVSSPFHSCLDGVHSSCWPCAKCHWVLSRHQVRCAGNTTAQWARWVVRKGSCKDPLPIKLSGMHRHWGVSQMRPSVISQSRRNHSQGTAAWAVLSEKGR